MATHPLCGWKHDTQKPALAALCCQVLLQAWKKPCQLGLPAAPPPRIARYRVWESLKREGYLEVGRPSFARCFWGFLVSQSGAAPQYPLHSSWEIKGNGPEDTQCRASPSTQPLSVVPCTACRANGIGRGAACCQAEGTGEGLLVLRKAQHPCGQGLGRQGGAQGAGGHCGAVW